MKLQIDSDLHLEFLQDRFPGECLISRAVDADILVLAGDIANGTQSIELFKNWPVPVLYLAGNHDFMAPISFKHVRHCEKLQKEHASYSWTTMLLISAVSGFSEQYSGRLPA